MPARQQQPSSECGTDRDRMILIKRSRISCQIFSVFLNNLWHEYLVKNDPLTSLAETAEGRVPGPMREQIGSAWILVSQKMSSSIKIRLWTWTPAILSPAIGTVSRLPESVFFIILLRRPFALRLRILLEKYRDNIFIFATFYCIMVKNIKIRISFICA
jgi:hypothetical protein